MRALHLSKVYMTVLILFKLTSAQIQCNESTTCPLANGGNESFTTRVCTNGYCTCNKDRFMNFTAAECLEKTVFMDTNNVTEYKGKPGDYCASLQDCIDGLECQNTACRCPQSCSFMPDPPVCDCGSELPGGVIAVTALLVILNSACWCVCFVRTKKRYSENGKVYSNADTRRLSTMTPVGGEAGGNTAPYYVNTALPPEPPYSYHMGTHLNVPTPQYFPSNQTNYPTNESLNIPVPPSLNNGTVPNK